jgi:hypothetical protein
VLSPDVIQAAVIALLKADAPLVAALTDATSIKEAGWRGTTFNYPAIRLSLTGHSPKGNGQCAEANLALGGRLIALSKDDSSDECLKLLGLMCDAIQRKRLAGTGLTSMELRPEITSYPVREDTIWRGEIVFATTTVEI